MTTPRILRKLLASVFKRLHLLTSGGYSVGNAYGARFLFDWRHTIDKKVALELYEHDQIGHLIEYLDQIRADIFVDIGSHAGLYSIILKTRFPELEVHAFEPDHTNLCQLYANLFVNKLQSRVRVHEVGISNKAGAVSFVTSEETDGRGTRRISSTGNIKIQVKRLDDVLTDKNRIAAMKIDVEGHENQVVDGAQHFLNANKCLLQIESSGENLDVLAQKLKQFGYRFISTVGGQDHYFTNIEIS
jgi:FkbM family methyltransferase